MNERDERYDNAVKYTAVLNEVPLVANEINLRARLAAEKPRGKISAGNSIDKQTGVKFEAHYALLILSRIPRLYLYSIWIIGLYDIASFQASLECACS